MPGGAILHRCRSTAPKPGFGGRFGAAYLVLLLVGIAAFYSQPAGAQEYDSQQIEQPTPNQNANQEAGSATASSVPRVTVHGVVTNSANGEPLARALVRIEGDASSAALTDGEGRYEINGVPVGMQIMGVSKPGYRDDVKVGADAMDTVGNDTVNFAMHNVRISPDMPDLDFSMAPTNAVRGQIDLSTGDPAQGIGVSLLRRIVQDGRAVWQMTSNTRTNSDGAFRFAGLPDGDYIVYTEPSLDAEIAAVLLDPKLGRQMSRAGFPSVFYPDARDINSAGKIHLAGGETAQANLLLSEETFHLVKAAVTFPGPAPAPVGGDRPTMPVDVAVLDPQGHHMPYAGMFDWRTGTAQAFLPDGTYALLITAMPNLNESIGGGRYINLDGGTIMRRIPDGPPEQLAGESVFSVSGRAVTSLRIPLARSQGGQIHISLMRTNTQASAQPNQQSPIVVMASQAGGLISDGMVSSFGEGYVTSPIETTFMNPGLYWLHTNIPQKQYCEASFTAGGASLAREPLSVSISGFTAPLTLTLRDDCATLKVSLPAASLDTAANLIEPFYTIYVIPDFDSTTDITPLTLRPSSGGSISVNGLTPGSYHVYTFAGAAELEYHNPDVLAALSSAAQAVTLSPGMTSDLVVEVPKH